MNKAKGLAEMLNGNEYRAEITPELESELKENGLVVIFGYSDDGVELRGAINEEIGAFGGTEFFLRNNEFIQEDVLNEELAELDGYKDYINDLVKKDLSKSKIIKANFDDGGYTWTFETELEHETFDIMDDGEKFCRGIIIDTKIL